MMLKSNSLYLVGPLFVYTAATILHFVHNAVFLSSYPNMPSWISPTVVYGTLALNVGIGAIGYLVYTIGLRTLGLVIMGIYATLGFDGLAHYSLAPVSAHTAMMNLTIWLEVLSAALLVVILIRMLLKPLVYGLEVRRGS